MRPVYVSTMAFGTGSLNDVLQRARAAGIQHIELGANIRYEPDLAGRLQGLQARYDLRFLVHNYFPPPQTPFVLNLASTDATIRTASRAHCHTAIALCAAIAAPLYSFHAGFCFHARPEDLGARQIHLPRIARNDAWAVFVDSLLRLCDTAEKYGINLAVENNVITPENRSGSGDAIYLGARAEELLEIISKVNSSRLFLLLDMGHLKVTAAALNLNMDTFVKLLAPRVMAVHLSDNDGLHDQHAGLSATTGFWPLMPYLAKTATWILEVRPSEAARLTDQITLCRRKMLL